MNLETALSPAPEGHNRPRKARPMKKHTCPECGVEFRAVREAKFCSDAHKNAYHNRNMKRGKVAMPLLQAWRGTRGSKANKEVGTYSFAELCALADLWNAEDRDAGRAPAWEMVKPKMQEGWKAVDLNR